MTLHNPAQLDPSLVGPHHKLLSTEDLSNPLPKGAEVWSHHPSNPSTWMPSPRVGGLPDKQNTYRIPLTLSDRLKAERDRLDEQIRVVEAVEKGAEYEAMVNGKWYSPGEYHSVKNLQDNIAAGHEVRLKPLPPTPRSIPWTLDSHPDVAIVKHKDQIMEDEFLIIRWRKDCAYLDGPGWVYYADLHRDWLQRNGDAAGQEVEG